MITPFLEISLSIIKAMAMRLLPLLYIFALFLMGCNDFKEITDNHPYQYEISQKSELRLIHNQFYRNKNGYLYQKTISQRKINGELKDVEYFNGGIPQDIDPLTFEQIDDNWYAKDKNSVYFYRPTSGGMQINNIKEADLNSFKPLDYNFAVDKNHYYHEGQIIENFDPNETQIIKNSQGKIIALQSNKKNYRLSDE